MDGKYSKLIFARNLQRLMDEKGKSRREVCEALGLSYYTFTDWVKGKKFPRIDKIEMLEDYFQCDKADLLEDKMTPEKEKDNDVMADIIVRMRMDIEFFHTVEVLQALDSTKLKSVQEMLKAFAK